MGALGFGDYLDAGLPALPVAKSGTMATASACQTTSAPSRVRSSRTSSTCPIRGLEGRCRPRSGI
jgi:hypothetical protein